MTVKCNLKIPSFPMESSIQMLLDQEEIEISLREKIRILRILRKLNKLRAGHPIALFLNDYNVGVGASGGSKRILEIIHGTQFSGLKLLLTFTNRLKLKIKIQSENFIILEIPKSLPHLMGERLLCDTGNISVDDIAATIFCDRNKILAYVLDKISTEISHVILEHPYMAPVLHKIRSLNRSVTAIYNSHNVESDMKSVMLEEGENANRDILVDIVHATEKYAASTSAIVNCVTEDDCVKMEHIYGLPQRPHLLINGARIIENVLPRKWPGHRACQLVFVGSAHGPNYTAMVEILTSTEWKMRPEYHLHIVGSVCSHLGEFAAHNVTLYGVLSDIEKDNVLSLADIALNPITKGGGSSLKVGEYLSHALPVVTTSEGVRGFDLKDGISVLNGSMTSQFFEAIDRLSRDQDLYELISRGGLAFAKENLSWENVTKKLSEQLSKRYISTPTEG
ncbi:glycosyltransferase [Paenirhodobacter populi]|uniref:glycosyltransferase n=1 Tax=Paenirhodobacter populi TaxID=2306993 RepID=UPI000FE34CBE|nr:glycosyltransferase [Sinirhodobacter populi]RWR04679.1 glycosyltransferase [Sinirhodobacter populi]